MMLIGFPGAMLQASGVYRLSADLLAPVLETFSAGDPLSALEELRSGCLDGSFSQKAGSCSTYPSDDSEDDACYPKFIGVANGMELLSDALEAMGRWAERADRTYKSGEKCAVLLTDKWDAAEFEEYEQSFRYLAMNRNFWFIFLLATKYGCTEIPFLPPELYSFTRLGGGNHGRNKS